jgi:hypothetical protein
MDLVGTPIKDSPILRRNIAVGITSQDHLSYLRRYFDSELGRIYPYLTAIINVKDGKVIGISWDDACEFCGSDTCEENTVDFNGMEVTEESSGGHSTKGCYITQEDCNALAVERANNDLDTNPIICQVLVNVVWSGTDSAGKSFQSDESGNGNGAGGGDGSGSESGVGMTLVVIAMTVATGMTVGAGWS